MRPSSPTPRRASPLSPPPFCYGQLLLQLRHISSCLLLLLAFTTITVILFPPTFRLPLILTILTILSSFILGKLTQHIALPTLVGQLLCGISIRLCFEPELPTKLTSLLKSLSLTVLLVRAGISINIPNLLPSVYLTIALSFFPFFCEATIVGLLSWTLLNKASALMIGALVSDVSPAVTTPIFLSMLMRYGSDPQIGDSVKRMTSVLLASSNINSVVAIHCFYIAFEVTFHTGSPLVRGMIGFAEAVIGPVLGLLAGWFVAKLGGDKPIYIATTLMLVSTCFLLLGSELRLSGGGALAALSTAVAVFNPLPWRHRPGAQNLPTPNDTILGEQSRTFSRTFSGASSSSISISDAKDSSIQCPYDSQYMNDAIAGIYRFAWDNGFEACLFGLLGCEIDLSKITSNALFCSTAIIISGLVVRFIVAFFCCRVMGGWNWQNSLFVATCWIPKATVQAALCTIALDFVRSEAWWDLEKEGHPGYSEAQFFEYREKWEGRATDVLNVGVLSIVLTAPICAFIIPKLIEPLVEEPFRKKAKEAEILRQRNNMNTNTSMSMNMAEVQVGVGVTLGIGLGGNTWNASPSKEEMEEIKRVKSV